MGRVTLEQDSQEFVLGGRIVVAGPRQESSGVPLREFLRWLACDAENLYCLSAAAGSRRVARRAGR